VFSTCVLNILLYVDGRQKTSGWLPTERVGSMKVDVSSVSRDGTPLEVTLGGECIGKLRPDICVADDVHFTGRLTKRDDDLIVRGSVHGAFQATCSRCLAEFGQEFAVSVSARYVLETENATERADREEIGYDGVHIDLVPVVRDELFLEAPVKPLCSPECRGLCPSCGTDLNKGSCNCGSQSVDPRLAALKNILDRPDS